MEIQIPNKARSIIEAHPEIDWSTVINNAISEKMQQSERLQAIQRINNTMKNSEFSEEDSNRLGELAKRTRLNQLRSEGII
tara:strand:- start:186 stop:428 length:243 start_codon:yes stop_codon:yes gene_type:complete